MRDMSRSVADGGVSPTRSLIRGLCVIRCMSEAPEGLTLSDIARRAGISPATAGRVLATLQSVGYVTRERGRYRLTARVLELGYSYLSSSGLGGICLPHMQRLSEAVAESTSVAVLDAPDIVYVARVARRRLGAVTPTVGWRAPAFASALGRVMLAELPAEELTEVLELRPLVAFTEKTITTPRLLRKVLADAKVAGFAIVEQEIDIGVTGIAVPLRGRGGRVVAALNVGALSSRASRDRLLGEFLPALLSSASSISDELSLLPEGGV